MRALRKKYRDQSGFSFIELLLSLGVISVLGFTALQSKIEKTEKEVADAFGTSVALYSQAVASYIADEGVGVPSGTFSGFDWLKSSGCGGSAPEDYVPCSWNPRLPFNIQLETEVIYGTGVATDPCPEPIGHVCAETRLTVPATNGQERLDLAAEMLHATQGSSNSIRSTQQRFSLNDVGQLQVTAVGTQAPPTMFLRVDGVNNMDGTLNMGDAATPHNLVDVGDLTAEGEVEMARFVDRDNPAFVMDPHAQSILQSLDARGDFAAASGGNLNALSVFGAGADIESAATFDGEANLYDLAKFIGGETDFNAPIESSGGTAAQFTVADSQDLADFHSELEIVGIGVVGGACNATIENIRFNSAGEMLECVSGLWQYAGIETKKGTITYYSLDSTNSYGEFFWAGDGIDLPGKHHVCSAQSIESSNLAEGGGARIESTSGPDQFGRRSFQYLAAAGVLDAANIPLQLQSGERTVICLALGPEPVQATVGTQTNTAPMGNVSCTSGYVSEPFLSTLNVSDPDTPLLYSWSTSGPCSIVRANTTGNFQAEAWIQRGTSSGTCTVRVQVTDYYNATRTISRSCQVWPRPCPTVQGLCSCTGCHSGTNIDTTPSEPSGYDSRPPPDGSGPWDPTETWICRASCGGSSDGCTEGSACSGPEPGRCSTTINRCSDGNSIGYSASRTLDETIHRWTCRGINGGSNAPCEVRHDHTRPCNPVTDRVNAVCGTAFTDCTAGRYDPPPGSNLSWVCRGLCGGNDAECGVTTPPVVDGACGDTAILNDCAAGNDQSVSGTSWICRGSNGGNDEPCTLTQPIVNGRCGIGSLTNIGDCSVGTSSGTNPWTCAGSGGGIDVTCEFGVCNDTTTPPCDVGDFENITGTPEWRCEGNIDNTLVDNATCVIAVCGDTQGTCDEGTDNGINPWTCAGGAGHGTADDVNCYVGACGTADDSAPGIGCTVGDWEHVDDTATDVLWDCKGSYHDPAITTDDIRCTLGLPICGPTRGTCAEGTPVGTGDDWICRGATTDINCHVGICDSGFVGDCAEGAPTSIINPLTLDTNPWTCQGSYYDPAITTDDDDCFFGVCNDDENSAADTNTDGCMVGTWVSVPDLIGPPPTIRWTCAGSFPGETNDDDPCTQRNGACDSIPPLLPGECDAGVSNDPSGATNPWICEGTGGGTDETCTIGVCGDEDDLTNGCRTGIWQAAPDHEWTCTGNVKDTGCYHGVCDYSGPGQCVAPSTPSSLDYEWTCRGADSMSTADDVDCIKAQCKDPGGQDNVLEGCKTGVWEHVDGPTWNCMGNHPTASYTLDDKTGCMGGVEPGRCGYDFVGDCDAGRKAGLGNEWKCLGPDDTDPADDDSCAIGECPTTSAENGTCVVGDAEYLYGTTYTDGDDWKCKGLNTTGTNDDVTCEPIIDGACGDATDTCYAGTFSGLPDDTWRCLGINGGDNDTCPLPETEQNNGCGEQENTCLIQGISYSTNSDQSYMNAQGCSVHTVMTIVDMADTPDLLKWRCQYGYSGSCPGGNAVSGGAASFCEIPAGGCGSSCPTSDYSPTPLGPLYWDTDQISDSCRVSLGNAYPYGTTLGIWPPNQLSCDVAQCGTTQNTCGSGQYLAYNESLGQWACLTAGPNNAGNVVACMPSVDGACGTADNAVQGCTAGTWQDETGDGWTCLGTGGGADASCPAACALSNFTWIAACGGGGIDCEGYYETNYDHCIVTNPKQGALYYQDAVGYGVSFIGYTPSDPIGDVTVEYSCCTNCDDIGSPITDPDNDCSWPPVTPVVDDACDTSCSNMRQANIPTSPLSPGGPTPVDAWSDTGSQCCLHWIDHSILGCVDKNVASCQMPICGNTMNTCNTGIVFPVDSDFWYCISMGSDGRGEASACLAPASVDGVCGTAVVGDCDEGDPADVDTGAGTWTCEGTGGGADASCGTPLSCYYSCEHLNLGLIGGSVSSTWTLQGICEDNSGFAYNSGYTARQACVDDMEAYCTPVVHIHNDSQCCTSPGACPPSGWSPPAPVHAACGTANNPQDGCLSGTYIMLDADTWGCWSGLVPGGTDVNCP